MNVNFYPSCLSNEIIGDIAKYEVENGDSQTVEEYPEEVQHCIGCKECTEKLVGLELSLRRASQPAPKGPDHLTEGEVNEIAKAKSEGKNGLDIALDFPRSGHLVVCGTCTRRVLDQERIFEYFPEEKD